MSGAVQPSSRKKYSLKEGFKSLRYFSSVTRKRAEDLAGRMDSNNTATEESVEEAVEDAGAVDEDAADSEDTWAWSADQMRSSEREVWEEDVERMEAELPRRSMDPAERAGAHWLDGGYAGNEHEEREAIGGQPEERLEETLLMSSYAEKVLLMRSRSEGSTEPEEWLGAGTDARAGGEELGDAYRELRVEAGHSAAREGATGGERCVAGGEEALEVGADEGARCQGGGTPRELEGVDAEPSVLGLEDTARSSRARETDSFDFFLSDDEEEEECATLDGEEVAEEDDGLDVLVQLLREFRLQTPVRASSGASSARPALTPLPPPRPPAASPRPASPPPLCLPPMSVVALPGAPDAPQRQLESLPNIEGTAIPVKPTPTLRKLTRFVSERLLRGERPEAREDDRASALAFAEDSKRLFRDATLLGHTAVWNARAVHLNTLEPFVLAVLGENRSERSHTMAAVLEACAIPFPLDGTVLLAKPMAALVLHFDASKGAFSEVVGMVAPNPDQRFKRFLKANPAIAQTLPRDRLVVLVSPLNYERRRAFYGALCEVRPLLFRWSTLTTENIRRLLQVGDSDYALPGLTQLFRLYEKQAYVPDLPTFAMHATNVFAPTDGRTKILWSFMAEAPHNHGMRERSRDLWAASRPGAVVAVDLGDPELSVSDVNAVFQVLVDQFRVLPMPGDCGKIVALEEAHRYLSSGDRLTEQLVLAARSTHPAGLRVIVSSQTPLVVSPELLELVTVAAVHRMEHRDGLAYLAQHRSVMSDCDWSLVPHLKGGCALMLAEKHMLGSKQNACVKIRKRLTSSVSSYFLDLERGG